MSWRMEFHVRTVSWTGLNVSCWNRGGGGMLHCVSIDRLRLKLFRHVSVSKLAAHPSASPNKNPSPTRSNASLSPIAESLIGSDSPEAEERNEYLSQCDSRHTPHLICEIYSSRGDRYIIANSLQIKHRVNLSVIRKWPDACLQAKLLHLLLQKPIGQDIVLRAPGHNHT